jgi:two-component system, NarL family, sensor histidine kinase UhpB
MREAVTAGPVPTDVPSGRPVRPAQAHWRARTLRSQLLSLFILIELIAAAVAGAVSIFNARSATRVEIAASMELAELWVKEAVLLAQRETLADRFLADLSSQLRRARHVRIEVRDAAGNVLEVRPAAVVPAPGGGEPEVPWLLSLVSAPAPAWFAALIAPPNERRVVPVVVQGVRIGSVDVVSEPKDEIGEKWETTAMLGAVGLGVTLAVTWLLYLLVGRVLKPLTGLAAGLAELEHRRYRVRLDRPQPAELAIITDRFNALAEALEATLAENQSLNRRLITAQDDERRRTALDLHDEVGPSLFGLKAHAASMAKAAEALPEGAAAHMTERVRDLNAIIDHLQAINRGMLNRLRPMSLGQLPLADVLSELVSGRAREYRQIRFSFAAEAIERSYGEPIDLTLYRCIQEGLTNVIRHAEATSVDVRIATAQGGSAAEASVILTVRDDGRGIDPLARKGLGSLGMKERVECLGGDYAVESERGRGTSLRVVIPLRATQNVQNDAGSAAASKT